MEYRAVGNRCAVRIDALELPMSYEEALTILRRKGFTVIESPTSLFVGDKFRGVRRYISTNKKATILEIPIGREIEIEDDIRWIILECFRGKI